MIHWSSLLFDWLRGLLIWYNWFFILMVKQCLLCSCGSNMLVSNDAYVRLTSSGLADVFLFSILICLIVTSFRSIFALRRNLRRRHVRDRHCIQNLTIFREWSLLRQMYLLLFRNSCCHTLLSITNLLFICVFLEVFLWKLFLLLLLVIYIFQVDSLNINLVWLLLSAISP